MAVRWNSSLELMVSSTVEPMVLSVLEAMMAECGGAKRIRMLWVGRECMFARTKLFSKEIGVELSELCNLTEQVKVQM